jgi:mannose-1-phosphate guanylyltransferase/phosphomannomutase
MKAVIMAGGKGSRLRPLTCNTPKPMVPLLNRPCMEYIIELLKKHRITEIGVTVQYLSEVIRNYFNDGADFGVNLRYFEETKPLGTAGSVKNAEAFLDQTFIVISGDGLTDFNLDDAIAFHREKGAIATLVLTKVQSPLEYGVVMTDDNGRIKRFLEKPSWSEVFSDTVNTGIYILEPEIFNYFEKDVVYDFGMDLFPLLLNDGQPMYGFVAEGYWSDIGNLQQYRQTQFDMMDGKVNVNITAHQVADGIFLEENAVLPEKVKITGPVYIGSNCSIAEKTVIGEYTVLGRNNMVQSGTSVHRSILWDGIHVSSGSELQGATICSHVNVGTGSTLFEGSVVGPNCTIGAKSSVRANVKLWPNKHVQDNSTVHTSLIWGEQMMNTLFGSHGVSGIPNVDITPDFVSRLASSYGAILPQGSTIGISSSAHPFAEMIKNAITAGLHSAGIHTLDQGSTISAVARSTVRRLRLEGAIHIRIVSMLGEKRVLIEFMDSEGLPIAKNVERKIENSFFQEDYVRSNMERIGATRHYTHAGDDYIRTLIEDLRLETVRTGNLKIVFQYDQNALGQLATQWIRHLNCRVMTYHSNDSSSIDLSHMVKNNQADFGVYIDENGQGMVLVDEHGTTIGEDLMLALKVMVLFKNKRNYSLGIPVSAPHIIETIATNLNGNVIRTKENARAMMEVCSDKKFHPLFDDLYMVSKIIEYMTVEKLSFSQIIQQIPQFYIVREEVPCPWSEKGRIMRMLMSETRDQSVELVDGIKIFNEGGWVLILPDLDEPTFKIIAQSQSFQHAKAMIAQYSKLILDSAQR